MRKFFYLLFFVLFVAGLPSAAQDTIAIKMHAPVSKVLDAIEQQSGFLFVASDVDLDRKVDIDVQGQSIETVLKLLFAGSNVTWRIDGVNVYLFKQDVQDPAGPAKGKKKNSLSGKVVDSQGVPVPGVVVMVNGQTDNVSITDSNGLFSVNAKPGSSLLFSCLGYIDHHAKVGNSLIVNITLQEEIMSLDETVVVGYRTVKKLSMTGAVSSLDLKQKENQTITNTSQLLYNTPGVFVNQGGSKPGADAASITIRGVNSGHLQYSVFELS